MYNPRTLAIRGPEADLLVGGDIDVAGKRDMSITTFVDDLGKKHAKRTNPCHDQEAVYVLEEVTKLMERDDVEANPGIKRAANWYHKRAA